MGGGKGCCCEPSRSGNSVPESGCMPSRPVQNWRRTSGSLSKGDGGQERGGRDPRPRYVHSATQGSPGDPCPALRGPPQTHRACNQVLMSRKARTGHWQPAAPGPGGPSGSLGHGRWGPRPGRAASVNHLCCHVFVLFPFRGGLHVWPPGIWVSPPDMLGPQKAEEARLWDLRDAVLRSPGLPAALMAGAPALRQRPHGQALSLTAREAPEVSHPLAHPGEAWQGRSEG